MAGVNESRPIERCPFCGSPALPMTAHGGWAVYCNADGTVGPDAATCGAVGPVRLTADAAIEAWNERMAKAIFHVGLRNETRQIDADSWAKDEGYAVFYQVTPHGLEECCRILLADIQLLESRPAPTK